jgi:serine/threonine protein kinase
MNERSSHKSALPVSSGSTSNPKTGSHSGSSSRARSDVPDEQMTIISSRVPAPSLSVGRNVPPLDSGGLLEGEQLGQFQLEKFVGGGGMGVVFRALDTTLNRQVAVKVLSRDQSADEETLRRFRNEAQSAARLNHENIARVHYVGEDRGVHYIVFEFIEGINIRDLVARNGPLPLGDALSYTYQIAQALEHASQRAVIHRDIKPSNVLITYDGKAKLVDMGLARLNQMAAADNDLTASGVTLGTFDYISPEQARDPRSADVRSDLYSLGCSFFFMLTGRPPFPDGTVLQKLLQHQADEPPELRSVRPDLPPEVARILTKLLAKNPAQRYQDPSGLIDDLANLGQLLGMQLSASRPHWSPQQSVGPLGRWQQHVPWAAPLAALFVTVMGLDYYWSASSADPSRPTTPIRNAAQARAVVAPASPIIDPLANPDDDRSSNQIPNPPSTSAAASTPKTPTNPVPDEKKEDPGDFIQRVLEPLGGKSLGKWKDRTSKAADALIGKEDSNTPPGGQSADPQPAGTNGPGVAKPPGAYENLLVVGDESAARHYATLHAACKVAKSGDIIELRYEGRRIEKPMSISNIKLTIRAGDGYQPVVVFRPEPELVPLKYPTTMLNIAGAQLLVTGIHWELDLPRNVPPEWALFETRHAELVQFDNCTFTIRNSSRGQSAYHAGVAFFDIKAPPGAGGMVMGEVTEQQIVTLNLRNCVARGEAVFLRTNELQAVRLNWDNGFLATSERLLTAAGGPSQPRQLGNVQINLNHVTAMVHGGLALLTNSEDAPYQLVTEINCVDSILASSASVPLVEQRGSDSIDEYFTRLQWSGNRDFFDGFEVFWQILNTAGQTASRQMRFDQWQDHWGAQSRSQTASSKLPYWRTPSSSEQPCHDQSPADYAVDPLRPNNPAVAGASDGFDAGCILSQLPALPPEQSLQLRD